MPQRWLFLGAEARCAEDCEVHSSLLQKGRGATLQSIQAQKTRSEAAEVAWWLRALAALQRRTHVVAHDPL